MVFWYYHICVKTSSQVLKTFFLANSTKHTISTAPKKLNAENTDLSCFKILRCFIIYYVMNYRKTLIKYNAYISQP